MDAVTGPRQTVLMPPRTVTTARQRRLGVELRRMRERAGYSAREAAAALGIDHTKISQMENARFGVSGKRVRVLASAYGCDDQAYVEALVLMAGERRKGWWERYRGTLPDGFLDVTEMEYHASSLTSYQIAHIPGVAQTEEYARAVFELTFPRLPEKSIEARIEHRGMRMQILDRADPPQFKALVHEAALRMRFGGRQVMRDQLSHLVKLTEHPAYTVRVLPFDADGCAGAGQAVLYASGPVRQLDTVHLDSAHGAVFLDGVAELRAYQSLLTAMERRSLGVKASRDFIKEIARQL